MYARQGLGLPKTLENTRKHAKTPKAVKTTQNLLNPPKTAGAPTPEHQAAKTPSPEPQDRKHPKCRKLPDFCLGFRV